ncbi:MAG TPA: hypothetical protein VE309_14435 [Caulobacteraceae bacterium]|nr:hypothetical protein [Caulobacteraceae bacterium]
MFDHVTLLLSFVYAIALTHLLSSATELVLARERVRFSALQAVWMLNALVGLLVNWLSLWGQNILKHWTIQDVLLWFLVAIVQYFTCSLVSIRPEPGEPIDMGAFFERQRRPIGGAFAALMAPAMIVNYVYRDATQGLGPTAWITEDLLVLPMLVAALICGWARPRWLQWAAGLAMLALETWFLCTFAVTD